VAKTQTTQEGGEGEGEENEKKKNEWEKKNQSLEPRA